MNNIRNNQYKVFARKYRPQGFDQLIGQEFLVKTLSNAIKYERLAHAFILTGVRGVGKTTTARILAKGLNCIGENGKGNITLQPCGICNSCKDISNGRHIDVLEMDAASNTGVDDVREIIENSSYKPISSRYKVFIIDEIHMLSKNAFNALLKTLEEPPDTVKFIFATTEIRKVPVTVLSRCQRFDLKRVSIHELDALLIKICSIENIKSEKNALKIIARASEGSVRDALSLLDQANALCKSDISENLVLKMLGKVNDEKIANVTHLCLDGNISEAVKSYNEIIQNGADPGFILSDILDVIHLSTLKTIGVEKLEIHEILEDYIIKLSNFGISKLGRAWQIIINGFSEIKIAPNTKIAVEMILIRLANISTLPTPSEIIYALENDEKSEKKDELNKNPVEEKTKKNFTINSSDLKTIEQIAKICEINNEAILGAKIRKYFKTIKISPGILVITKLNEITDDTINLLQKKLSIWTNIPWEINTLEEMGDNTIFENEKINKDKRLSDIKQRNDVTEVLETFPDAKITSIKDENGNLLLGD